MYLSKLIGYFVFSNYTHTDHKNMSPDQLIARTLIPKKIANWVRSFYDRKITVQHPDAFFQDTSKTESKKLDNKHTKKIIHDPIQYEPKIDNKKLITENEKKIEEFFSSNLKDYINNIYECDLLAESFFDSLETSSKKTLKNNIIRCSHFITAYPNYATMTSEELKKTFLSTPHIPVKTLSESDIREATNFALRHFIEKNQSYYIIDEQDLLELNEESTIKLEQYKHVITLHSSEVNISYDTPYNRIFVTESSGNEHLKYQSFNDNSPNSLYYSFDLLEPEKRRSLLRTMVTLLSKNEDQ